MINSKQKGKVGELELVNRLKARGFKNAHRSQQYCGAHGDADIVGIPNFHIECKRTENGHGKLYRWIEQAKKDTQGNIPLVIHRKNREEWLVTLELEHFLDLLDNLDKL